MEKEATIACPLGYAGTYSRRCGADQQWGEPDLSTCTRLHCAAEGIWVTTNTLTNATLSCGGDLRGEITRYCDVDQRWHAPDDSQCRGGSGPSSPVGPNYCAAEDGWPTTYPGAQRVTGVRGGLPRHALALLQRGGLLGGGGRGGVP